MQRKYFGGNIKRNSLEEILWRNAEKKKLRHSKMQIRYNKGNE
jgi:hypothetical protein